MLEVAPIPILGDNYVWVIRSPKANECIVVDPGDATNVINFLKSHEITLTAILITHSHYDHVDGIEVLLNYCSVPVYGPKSAAIPLVSIVLSDNDRLRFWDIDVQVMRLPGHMPEHLAYVFNYGKEVHVFSGDVLFSSGCGRIFNGSHLELKSSLDRLKALPNETVIYPTHEYTLSNLRFALAVEPNNEEIKERQRNVQALRDSGIPSLPTTIKQEKQVNPFLRCNQARVIESVESRLKRPPNGDLEVFTTLRKWKDEF